MVIFANLPRVIGGVDARRGRLGLAGLKALPTYGARASPVQGQGRRWSSSGALLRQRGA